MNLRPYPEYKDSGVEWLGDVPSSWQVAPIKFVTSYNDEVLQESTLEDAEIRYVEISDVSEAAGVRFNRPIRFGEAPSRARRIVRQGDVLVSTVRTYLRSIAGVQAAFGNVVASTGFAVLRAANIEPRFLQYGMLTEYVIDEVISRSVGISYPAINASDLVRVKLPMPPVEEQRDIADFLDHETAEIDAFIADQNELIGLLNERRAATITQGVTKGLDPNVPMKDSGLEWLGDVPSHWVVGPTKFMSDIALGKMLQPSARSKKDALGRYLRAANVQPLGQLALESEKEMWFSPAELARLNLLKGDVVIVEGGVGGFGRAAYIGSDLNRWAFQNSIIRLRPHAGHDGRFITYAYLHLRAVGYIHMTASVTSMPHFTAEKVEGTGIAWPNSKEQQQIADYLDHETAEIDAAIADAKEAIKLSKERRAALISAAVTGKIDVRGDAS